MIEKASKIKNRLGKKDIELLRVFFFLMAKQQFLKKQNLDKKMAEALAVECRKNTIAEAGSVIRRIK
ncbi:MAG: hypothetical protein KBF25_02380 [Chitinophagaceae bacterium]|nr:hypothetical protein [Chitinophagaceae bacterium]